MVQALIGNFKIYACIAFGAIVGYIVWHSNRVEAKNAELCMQIAQIKVVGEQAAAAAKKKEKQDAETIARLQARYSADLDELRADNERLRNYRPSSSSAMPVSATGARCPAEWACFDRAELSAALDRFVQDAAGVAEEGSEDRLRLSMAIEYIHALGGSNENKAN